jgi:NAD(P)-dependent dehydrogenase (short-subunit alcohol dehydrogenase family)
MTRIDSGTGTVLITGPTSGLGRDLTLELARRAANYDVRCRNVCSCSG